MLVIWRCLFVLGLVVSCVLTGLGQPIREIKIQFLGAARMVGGACFLVETDRYDFLVDSGYPYAEEGDEGGDSQFLPSVPSDVQAVILTHAHLDHWGRIPALVLREGWRGDIYLTEATADLLSHKDNPFDQHSDLGAMYNMLSYLDLGVERFGYVIDRCKSARESRGLCIVHSSIGSESRSTCGLNHGKSWEFIETTRNKLEGFRVCRNCIAGEVEVLRRLFVPKAYNETWLVTQGISAQFLNAGHIPGSAMVLLELETERGPFRILFSGDLGPQTHPFIPPWAVPTDPVDVLILETTYGGVVRANHAEELGRFRQELARALGFGRRVVIPVFGLDRAQRTLYELGQLKRDGVIPAHTPVYLGGGTKRSQGDIHGYTDLYRKLALGRTKYASYFTPVFFDALRNFEMTTTFSGSNPYGYKRLALEDSVPIGPCVVIATSGDCQYSVSERLLCNLGGDSNTEFFLVSYASGRSPCGKLREIAGLAEQKRISVKEVCSPLVDGQRVHTFSAFSGHADATELERLVFGLRGLSSVFLVHGEYRSMETFRTRLDRSSLLFQVPDLGEVYQLFPQVLRLSTTNPVEGTAACHR